MGFEVVTEFEKKVAEFFGAPYAVAVDSCTHAIELCLRLAKATHISVPRHTYLSVPMLADKLSIPLLWKKEEFEWQDCYNVYVYDAFNIWDAAVMWRRDSYRPGTQMCLSFQRQKHLSLGRGGMILLNNEKMAMALKKMSYDGRLPNIPWRDQNVDVMGYHYYMTPETAALGLEKLPEAIATEPRKWTVNDWPDLKKNKVFNGR